MSETIAPQIEITPGVCGGKPRIAGKRFTVQHVYVLHKQLRLTPEEIANDYDVTLAAVFAALAFAFDHREEIEESIRKDDVFFEEAKRNNPSKLQEILRERSGQILPR
jgi:uncharacterized protein (DUF433 family)